MHDWDSMSQRVHCGRLKRHEHYYQKANGLHLLGFHGKWCRQFWHVMWCRSSNNSYHNVITCLIHQSSPTNLKDDKISSLHWLHWVFILVLCFVLLFIGELCIVHLQNYVHSWCVFFAVVWYSSVLPLFFMVIWVTLDHSSRSRWGDSEDCE